MFVFHGIHNYSIGLQFLLRNYQINEQQNDGHKNYSTMMQSSIDLFHLNIKLD
jgi:hypothetical protein